MGMEDQWFSRFQLVCMDKYKRMNEDVTNHQLDMNIFANKYVLYCAVFASLNSVLLGYDVGVMSGAILFIQEDLKITKVQEEILVGCLSIISLLGSLGGGRTSDAIGRRWTMALAALIFQIGAVIMTFAPSFRVLMVGRLLAGVGIGCGVMIAPVYIAEISPSIARGSFTSFPETFINVGILLGYISNYAFSGLSIHINWRVMLGVGVLPSIFIGCALFFIPESPRWLVMENRMEEAREVLLKINDSDEEVEERLKEIEKAAEFTSSNKANAVWRELLKPSPILARMMITGLGIQFFQQITGIDATVYYSPTILKDTGIRKEQDILAAIVAIGFTKTSFTLVAIFLIDRVGRKPLLYVSTIGMTACLFALSVILACMGRGLLSHELGIVMAILAICGNVSFFSVGIGPVCWVLSSEIYPLRVRAQAVSFGVVANRVSSGFVAMSFLSISDAISVGGTFFIFSLMSAISVVFVYKFVPETNGKSLEQIELLFYKETEMSTYEVELGDAEDLVPKE